MADILIVEDDPQLNELLRMFLESKGHKVATANDGAVALELVRRSPPDMMITDLIMPQKEGIETILVLHREFPRMKIIAMSGESGVSHVGLRAAGFLGANAVLAKPFPLARLGAEVEKLLGSSTPCLADRIVAGTAAGGETGTSARRVASA